MTFRENLQHRADELSTLVGRAGAYTVINDRIVYHSNYIPLRSIVSEKIRQELYHQDNYDLDGNLR
jgi:hypothetical protein